MCDKCDADTGELLAVRYPNLDGNWLKKFLSEINDQVGRLKQNFKGNAIMQLPWKGGTPGQVDWWVKPGKPKT